MTLLALIQIWVHVHNHGGSYPSVRYILDSMLLNPASNAFPILSPGWTLGFEMAFYLLFAAALSLRVSPVRFITPILIAVAIFGFFRSDRWPMLISPLMLEFLFGLLLGAAVRRGYRPGLLSAIGLGVAGMAFLVFIPLSSFPGSRTIEWGIAAFFVVQAATMIEKAPKVMLMVGDASYSLYLSHFFIVASLSRFLGGLPESMVVAIGLAVSIGAALLLYRFIEYPFTDWLKGHVHTSIQWSPTPSKDGC
jgi:exopolysaccharide production protein ExoZ